MMELGLRPSEPLTTLVLDWSVCKSVCDLLGGELSIWSKPSLGTLVEGTVPVKFKAESSELTVGEPSERK